MKKLLLVAAATAALSSSAFAAESDTYYVTAKAGAVMLNKATDKYSGLKMKAKTAANFGLGVGYYFMDNVRADLELSFLANPELKRSGNVGANTVVGQAGNTKASVKHKGNVVALLLNAYVDLFDVSITKAFMGAGVGMAQVKEKISGTVTNAAGVTTATASESSKKKNNVAYQFTLGVSSEVAPGVNAELAYSWRDYGPTKAKAGAVRGSTRYKGHHLNAGVRFDL